MSASSYSGTRQKFQPKTITNNLKKVDINSPSNVLYILCKHILSRNHKSISDDVILSQHQYALRLAGCRFGTSPVITDEFQLGEKIKRNLAKQGRESDAAMFSELYAKLKGQDALQNRWSILYLLYVLSDDSKARDQTNYFGGGTLDDISMLSFKPKNALSNTTEGTSGYGSMGISLNTDSNLTLPYTPRFDFRTAAAEIGVNSGSQNVISRINNNNTTIPYNNDTHRNDNGNEEGDIYPIEDADTNTRMLSKCFAANADGTLYEITEKLLLRDILFVFQGIDGKIVRFDSTSDSYRISSDINVPLPIRDMVGKLAELGWLFRRVCKYLDARSGDKALGLVGQSFCAAIQKELTEYYRLVAVLEAQANQMDVVKVREGSGLTFRRLIIWTFDPLLRMKALATLVDVCKGKKGGSLLSSIYSHTQTGDPFTSKLVKHILHVVSHPIRSILERWIFDGELQDTYNEYFVAADPAVRNERLWHEKYTLRKQMLPSFIPNDVATKILNIGKSINFIRVVCEDRSPIFGHAAIEKLKSSDSEFNEELRVEELNSSALGDFIDMVYDNTSKHLLNVLFKRYKFLDHLKAMRRYLLLGQGDFIRHLMDLLEPDLVRPANSLYMHNLTGLLETAIRATNAQFDEPDILNRLDCRLLEISPGDCGWDVFSLDYKVYGPISTVFTPEVILHYLRIFNFLWRAKRMEYCLTEIWKNQMGNSRLLQKLPEVAPLLHISHCLEAEMVHFMHQMQYFITFEVLECCWEELLLKINKAKNLDDIISAHDTFLNQLMTRALMDKQSQAMLTQLRAIFDLIIQFQSTQESMYAAAVEELEARKHLERKASIKTDDGGWGLTEEDSRNDILRQAEFTKTFIPSTRAQLRVLHQSYQDMLQHFLVMLNNHTDVSLRFLCFRLDFNEYYKNNEPKLRSPTKYNYKYKKMMSGGENTKL